MRKHKDLLDDWQKAMEYGLIRGRPFSQSTVDVYMLYAREFIETYGEVSLPNLKKILLATPVTQFAKRYKIFQAIQCLAGYLIEEGELEPLYLEQAKAYIPRRHIAPKKLTVHEKGIEDLIQACKNQQDRLILMLLSFTGLRVTEAANLKITDIDIEKGYLTVRLAKWGKTRRVGLTSRLKEAIHIHLKTRTSAYQAKEWLFLNRFGDKVTRYGISTRLKKLGKRAGIQVTPHALRRAFVTINANKGRPLPMLQIACGHNNITTTRSYCMTSEDETIEAMQSWE